MRKLDREVLSRVQDQFDQLFASDVVADIEPDRWIAVIDAFDQCTGTPDEVTKLYQCLIRFPPSIKVIMSSRFDVADSSSSAPDLLKFAELTKDKTDMRIIAQCILQNLQRSRNLPASWPTEEDVDVLVLIAGDFPLISEVTGKLLSNADDPAKLLQELSYETANAVPNDMGDKVNDFYGHMLGRIFPASLGRRQRAEQLELYRQIVGTVIVAGRPIDCDELFAFLSHPPFGHSPTAYEARLNRLKPVLWIENGTLRFVHPSFVRYVTSASDGDESNKCEDIYRIETIKYHGDLALATLNSLNGLCRDPCKIGYEREFDELSARMRLDDHDCSLAYSSCFVGVHLKECAINIDIWGAISVFVQQHLMHWSEVLSGLREVGRALPILGVLGNKLEVCSK